jgi:hypothetical protein
MADINPLNLEGNLRAFSAFAAEKVGVSPPCQDAMLQPNLMGYLHGFIKVIQT